MVYWTGSRDKILHPHPWCIVKQEKMRERINLFLKRLLPIMEEAVGGSGTYRCGKCDQCPWIKEGEGCPIPRGGYMKSRSYADCVPFVWCIWLLAHVVHFTLVKPNVPLLDLHVITYTILIPACSIHPYVGMYHGYDPSSIIYFIFCTWGHITTRKRRWFW